MSSGSVSGRLLLRALADGEQDAEKLAELARGKLRSKRGELRRALEGRLTEVQRWVLGELLPHLEELDAGLTRVGERITEEVATTADPFVPEALQLLDSIPGIGERAAQIIIAEMGADMSQFPSADHLSSWAGMCPGNNESASKRRSGQTTKGSKQLRTALVEAAWGASRAKGTLLAAQYQRLVKRMGNKKALGARGHTILRIAYQLLKRRIPSQERTSEEVDRQQVARQRRRLVQKLEALGVKVTLEEVPQAA